MYCVYILYSESLQRHYVGSTSDFTDRLKRHNAGESNYTKKGIPWKLIHTIELPSRSEAIRLEKKIKKERDQALFKRYDFQVAHPALGGRVPGSPKAGDGIRQFLFRSKLRLLIK